MDALTLTALMEANATALDLTIDPACRAGTLVNLERLATMAHLVAAFPLPAAAESALVFAVPAAEPPA